MYSITAKLMRIDWLVDTDETTCHIEITLVDHCVRCDVIMIVAPVILRGGEIVKVLQTQIQVESVVGDQSSHIDQFCGHFEEL